MSSLGNRPTPKDNVRRALFGWLTDKQADKWAPATEADLPARVQGLIACGNVPELPGPVVIGLDTSGSMGSPVTGNRGRGVTSKMRCVDVAALFAAAILRRNPDSIVIPFDKAAYEARLDPQDTILSLAERLAKYGGGGTDCSLPLVQANGKIVRNQYTSRPPPGKRGQVELVEEERRLETPSPAFASEGHFPRG